MFLKGAAEPVQFTFIQIVLALIFVAALAVGPLQASVDSAVRSNEEIALQSMATSINIMQNAPVGSEYIVDIPVQGKEICKIEISKGTIKGSFSASKKLYAHYALKKFDLTGLTTIDCNQVKQIKLKTVAFSTDRTVRIE